MSADCRAGRRDRAAALCRATSSSWGQRTGRGARDTVLQPRRPRRRRVSATSQAITYLKGTTWQRVLIHPGVCPAVFTTPGTSSFTEFLSMAAPELLPGPPAAAARALPPTSRRTPPRSSRIAYADGVVMAGDRRATMGNLIASRDIEKVHPADAYSLVGIAGTAGVGIELMRLFQVELEHYEKIEGAMLSLDGKANRLATMIRNNLGAAHAGPRRGAAVRRLRPGRRPTRPRPAGSSASTWPAASTRRPATTRSAPARCSPSRR